MRYTTRSTTQRDEKRYRQGNLVQASEKYWRAVTALLNAIGELKLETLRRETS
ncbi:MAG: hypothetical protein DRJ40_10725 [Thermoprotei archaeon]|nr:MAG: hypothetical protein DRJ40_10725 [Thermoprotei archaeon]